MTNTHPLFTLPDELKLKVLGFAIEPKYIGQKIRYHTRGFDDRARRARDMLEPIISNLCVAFGGKFSKDFLFEAYCSVNYLTVNLKQAIRVTDWGDLDCGFHIFEGTFELHPEFEKHVQSLKIGGWVSCRRHVLDFVRKVIEIVKACKKLGNLIIGLKDVKAAHVGRVKHIIDSMIKDLRAKEDRRITLTFSDEDVIEKPGFVIGWAKLEAPKRRKGGET